MADDVSSRSTIRHERRDVIPPPESIAEHFPQLDIVEAIGRGGMGVVYKARQKGLDRMVALKILPPEPDRDERFAERFEREARALARLDHPNIVTVHDSGRAGDLYYLIMEFVDGANLRQMMTNRPIDPREALSIVPPLCDALQYAHDEGIMHRDIKPENVLIDRRGRVKIADFGLAKLLAGPRTDYTLTAPHQALGTMHYMAPEQIERPADVDHRADIYALGVVIYELLTGELPIGRFPLPSERTAVDHRLDGVVLHALEKEPDRRYQRVTDVKTDVQTITGVVPPPSGTSWSGAETRSGAGLPTPSFGAPAAPPTWRPRSKGTAYACWVLCLFLVCGIHRFYAGKWITGILWLCTFGLLGFGQLIDLFLIPGMIKLANLESAYLARTLADPARPASSIG